MESGPTHSPENCDHARSVREAPAFLPELLQADTLIALDSAAGAHVRSLLGPGMLAESAFVALDSPDRSCGMLITRGTLDRGRFHQPCRPTPALMQLLQSEDDCRIAPGPLDDWIDEPGAALEELAAAPIRCVFALKAVQGVRGIWLLGLRPPEGAPEFQAGRLTETLRPLAEALGMVFGHIFRMQQERLRHQQILDLHDAMLRIMVTTNREDMLARLLALMQRSLGFDRVFIALIHPQSEMLRSTLHTGFSTLFTPFSIGMDQRENFFVRATDAGEIRLYQMGAEASPEDLPLTDEGIAPGRAALIPLRVGPRPLGLIYADQPLHDGRPLFPEVLELFSRMAGAALENIQLRTSAEQRAETDPLTGLKNRFFLDKVLELEIPRVKRYNQPLSLLMIDLCDFKRTNDAYGHQFGDFILKESARLLLANVRRPDFVIRFGGDEFIVLMVNTAAHQATLVRDRIEGAFIERNRLQTDERMMIRISIGMRSADAGNIEALIYEADMAMYAHKARQKRRSLIKALLGETSEAVEAADKVVGSLYTMLCRKAPGYPRHARRVALLALRVGRRLGLPADELESLTLAALLHDVGMVSLPAEILSKTDSLTPAELLAVRHHPVIGEEFFDGIDFLEPLRPLIRSHHERYDGRLHGLHPGYPDGLGGEHIPLGARILKLAESVDRMVYGTGAEDMIDPQPLEPRLEAEAGHSFDPRLVRVLLAEGDWRPPESTPQALMSLLDLEADS